MDRNKIRAKTQYTLPESTLAIMKNSGIKRIQAITSSFLYYARAVDPCMLPDINEISSQQAQTTEETNTKTKVLMKYAHAYPDAKIRCHTSDMQLYTDSDADYLVLPKACSRGAVHFYFSKKIRNTT